MAQSKVAKQDSQGHEDDRSDNERRQGLSHNCVDLKQDKESVKKKLTTFNNKLLEIEAKVAKEFSDVNSKLDQLEIFAKQLQADNTEIKKNLVVVIEQLGILSRATLNEACAAQTLVVNDSIPKTAPSAQTRREPTQVKAGPKVVIAGGSQTQAGGWLSKEHEGGGGQQDRTWPPKVLLLRHDRETTIKNWASGADAKAKDLDVISQKENEKTVEDKQVNDNMVDPSPLGESKADDGNITNESLNSIQNGNDDIKILDNNKQRTDGTSVKTESDIASVQLDAKEVTGNDSGVALQEKDETLSQGKLLTTTESPREPALLEVTKNKDKNDPDNTTVNKQQQEPHADKEQADKLHADSKQAQTNKEQRQEVDQQHQFVDKKLSVDEQQQKAVDKLLEQRTDKEQEQPTDKQQPQPTEKQQEESRDKQKQQATDKQQLHATNKEQQQQATDKKQGESTDKQQQQAKDKKQEESTGKQQEHPSDKQQQNPTDKQHHKPTDKQQQQPTDRQQQKPTDRQQQQQPSDKQQQQPTDRQQQQQPSDEQQQKPTDRQQQKPTDKQLQQQQQQQPVDKQQLKPDNPKPQDKPSQQPSKEPPKKKSSRQRLKDLKNKAIGGDLMDACTDKPPQQEPVIEEKVEPVEIVPEVSDKPLEEDLSWGDKGKKIGDEIKVQKENDTEPAIPVKQTRRKYEREFLLQFQYIQVCTEKPAGLPDIEVVLDAFIPPTKGGGYQRVGSDFLTSYARQKSQGGGGRRDSRGKPPPRKIIAAAPQPPVVLRQSENRWLRPQEKEQELSEEEKKTAKLYRHVVAILNKLTPQKFKTLVEQIMALNIDTPERLEGVIDRIFEKAIPEPMFSVAYANMCRCLFTIKVPDADGKEVSFRKLLLNRFQKEFEKEKEDEQAILEKYNQLEGLPEEERKMKKEEMDEDVAKNKRRMLGSIKFIGELFKLKLLTENLMHDCIFKLLRAGDDESLESMCKLLFTIGKDLDSERAKPRMEQYFEQLNKIIVARKVSSRVIFMLRDVVEMRQNKWIPRREKHLNSKTIDQIHKEAQMEKMLEQRAAASLPVRDRKQKRGGGSGGRDSPKPVPSDGWMVSGKSGKPVAIDHNKLKSMAKRTNNEEISLGPSSRFTAWNRGSSVGLNSTSQEQEPQGNR